MGQRLKVMYVDDEEINVLLFELNFKKKYDIITALSGEEALELLDEHQDVQVVISDMRMPIMNGIEFIREAKSNHPDIRFFILTAFAISSEIQEAIDSKLIVKCFSKPLNIQEIVYAIEN